MKDLLDEYVQSLDPAVKRVLVNTMRIEAELLDIERPRGAKDRIRDVVEEEARREARQG